MSGFLLDTRVVCELIKVRPQTRVTKWIEATDESLLYLSVLSLGEMLCGIAKLAQTRRRTMQEAWLETGLRTRFHGRLLDLDDGVAERWGLLTAHAQKNKVRLTVMDGLLAATAQHHNLTLVTRGADHVARMGIGVFNPWLET